MIFDLRGGERYEYPDHRLEYSFGAFSDEIFEAELINANETGLCMLLPHRLDVGQEITLRDFMGFSARNAVVIWVEKEEEAGGLDESGQVLFRIGLRFSD